jgi:hypothetical protein
MSNHFSAANLKFPGNDRRLDLTDVFAFASSQDPDNTILIIDSNPTSAPPPIEAQARGPEFYRFAWLSNGKIPPQGLKPHDDLLAHFPYLGPPNP